MCLRNVLETCDRCVVGYFWFRSVCGDFFCWFCWYYFRYCWQSTTMNVPRVSHVCWLFWIWMWRKWNVLIAPWRLARLHLKWRGPLENLSRGNPSKKMIFTKNRILVNLKVLKAHGSSFFPFFFCQKQNLLMHSSQNDGGMHCKSVNIYVLKNLKSIYKCAIP